MVLERESRSSVMEPVSVPVIEPVSVPVIELVSRVYLFTSALYLTHTIFVFCSENKLLVICS